MSRHSVRVLLIVLALSAAALAQSAILDLPRQSQHAVLTQRVGITDITINYSRPLVKGRKVWGGLVPYGDVWRAGANENTTISFTDPVSIEGNPLPAGTYGLHMIPTQNEWTVIFSKNHTSWGSFTYDKAEDALRVTAKPQPTDMHEALTYDFDDVEPNSAVVTLRWEKLAVPFKVDVDTNKVVEASLRNQLRGRAKYTWDGWDDAANYLLQQKTDLAEALTYANTSIENEERFDNLMTKAKVLDAMGRKDDAAASRKLALSKANAIQLHIYARGLQNEGKEAEAFEVYRQNALKNPGEWIVHVGLSRMYSAEGNFPKASQEMASAIAAAPDSQKQPLAGLAKRLEAKQDINK